MQNHDNHLVLQVVTFATAQIAQAPIPSLCFCWEFYARGQLTMAVALGRVTADEQLAAEAAVKLAAQSRQSALIGREAMARHERAVA